MRVDVQEIKYLYKPPDKERENGALTQIRLS